METVYPFIISALTLASFFLGKRIRAYANVIIPFRDPISIVIFIAMFSPLFLEQLNGNVWVQSGVVSVFAGYTVGYLIEQPNLEYIGVHHIVDKVQDIMPIVYYYRDDGDGMRMYMQPQTFWGICKSMIFGVRYPLDLPLGMVQRKRHVIMRKIFIKADAEVIDLAGHTCETIEVKKGPFKFKVEYHHYIPTPYGTDAPYDFIVKSAEYEELMTRYNEMLVQNMEAEADLQNAAVRGAGSILSALGRKTPSMMFMDELGLKLTEKAEKKKAFENRVKKEEQEAQAVKDNVKKEASE